ncbi:MAG: hypothetical protein ACOCRU_00085 [bacterium]
MSIAKAKNYYIQHIKKKKNSRNTISSYSLNKKFIAGMATGTGAISGFALQSMQIQNRFNTIISTLNEQNAQLQNAVNQLTAGDFSLRNNGVRLAWQYEQGIVELGGRGTANWTSTQRDEILNYGRVRGMHGHHINDVSNHPKLQGDPDNIKFLSAEDHLRAHDGDWRNPTSGEMYNREAIMRRELFKGELGRFGLAILIGVGIGYAIASFDSKLTFKEKVLFAVEGGKVSSIGYLGGRVGGIFISALSSTEISQALQLAGIGASASIATSIFIFYKIKNTSGATIKAFQATSLNLAVSLTGVYIAYVANSLWGGTAGIVAGFLFAGIFIFYNHTQKRNLEKIVRDLQEYEIQLVQPVF